jgi:hypothetical protein
LSRFGQLGQRQLLTLISPYPYHILAWYSHKKVGFGARKRPYMGVLPRSAR